MNGPFKVVSAVVCFTADSGRVSCPFMEKQMLVLVVLGAVLAAFVLESVLFALEQEEA